MARMRVGTVRRKNEETGEWELKCATCDDPLTTNFDIAYGHLHTYEIPQCPSCGQEMSKIIHGENTIYNCNRAGCQERGSFNFDGSRR